MTRILVTGGGTGGHVGPALAVVHTLRQRDSSLEFLYIGSPDGVEAHLAHEARIPFVGVASGKLRRSTRGALGMLTIDNAVDACRVPLGLVQSLIAVQRFRPDVVFATGGYVCVPPVMAAALLRIPILTHEQTVTIGLANRIVGRYARRIALTFEGAKRELPEKLRARAFVTGNPVRDAIFQGDRARALPHFGFVASDNHLPCIYVTGGAQGAQRINQAVEEALPWLLAHARVIHQCGKLDEARLLEHHNVLPAEQQQRWSIQGFLSAEEVGDAYAVADLLVGRAGAGTVTETCALGMPAVFIPLVPTSGDEQTRNAQRSADAGAAVILPQSQCSGSSLQATLEPLLNDPARRKRMAEAGRKLATPRAADDLADALLALTKM